MSNLGSFSAIDLHVHLRGTMSPDDARNLASKHNLNLSPACFGEDGYYHFDGFEEFLDCYHEAGKAVVASEDLAAIAERYLLRAAAEGTLYVEFMHSPDHSADNGIAIEDQIIAIADGVERARKVAEIDANLIVTAVRHLGPDRAYKLAEFVTALNHPLVVGFGLTGNENKFDAREFAPAFHCAGAAGLGLTAHAGEWRSAETVLEAVTTLGISRVGHGISVAKSRTVMAELVRLNIGFEICLSSNQRLGAVQAHQQHPLPIMIESGCRVSLATDDPAFFDTTPMKELEIARREFGLSDEVLMQIAENSIEMAFCNEETKSRLRERLLGALS